MMCVPTVWRADNIYIFSYARLRTPPALTLTPEQVLSSRPIRQSTSMAALHLKKTLRYTEVRHYSDLPIFDIV